MDKKKPTVCVMMSTYNGERYLPDQLDSILAQKGDFRLTILIRDDGSTDGTQDILVRYAEQYPCIRWYTGKNLGSTLSFMDLVHRVQKFDFYAFSDQDDVWKPEKIDAAMHQLQSHSEPTLYSGMKEIVDKELKPLGQKDTPQPSGLLNAFLLNNSASGCTMVYNHAFQEQLCKIAFDWKDGYHDSLAYKLAESCGTNIFDLTPYIFYRQHGSNAVGAKHTGWSLFLDRLKVLSHYHPEQSRIPSRYAAYIIGSRVTVLPQNKTILHAIADRSYKMHSRFEILRYGGISKRPLYEWIWKNIQILLGWY